MFAELSEYDREQDGLVGTDSWYYGGEQSSFILIDQVLQSVDRLCLSHYCLL